MSGLSNTTQLYLLLRDNDTGQDKWTEMDLNDDMPFPLVYSIADVKDITKRNNSYSKTIRIPGTKHNNIMFSHFFDVSLSAAVPIFNPNKKVRCFILRDTIQVFEGIFQLRNIISKDNIHPEYECIIYGNSSSFSTAIKEKYLDEIKNLQQLDHYYTYDRIVETWDKDWTWGYYYPLVDYGRLDRFRLKLPFNSSKGIRVSDFKPAIYVKWLWDEIFKDAGFTYTSEFLNSEVFKRLIIPSGKLSIANSPFWMYLNTLRVGLSSNVTFPATQLLPVVPDPSIPYNPATYQFYQGTYVYRYKQRIPFNVDNVDPNGDPGDYWNTTTYEYTEGSDPKPQTFYFNLDYIYYNKWTGRARRLDIWPGSLPFFPPTEDYNFWNAFRSELRVKRSMDVAGNVVPGGVSVRIDNAPAFYSQDPSSTNTLGDEWGTGAPDFQGTIGATPENNDWVYLLGGHEYIYPADDNWPGNVRSLQPWDGISATNPYLFPLDNIVASDFATFSGFVEWSGQIQVSLDDSSPYNLALRPGEKLWIEVTNMVDRNTYNDLFTSGESPIVIKSSSLVFNAPNNEVTEGGVISVGDSLPEKVKQIDFITSIVRMFNLFIETDKNDARNLFIEPRDDYYEKGVNYDWSDKLDLLQETKHDIIAELQNKKLIYTYKEDKDLLNTVYQQRYDEIYGYEEYIIDNDFTTGEKKTEIIFSPTPLVQVPEMIDMVVPSIRPVDLTKSDKFAPKIRILQKRDNNLPLPVDSQWYFQGITQSSYPYAGNLDHPTEGTLDLNFGPVRELYYPENLLTQNTLFNVYHRRMVEELTDRSSRLITAYFYLDAQDVNRLRFNDTIFVDQLNSGTGVYYRLNKIEYDPMRDGSYRVELLKILNKPSIYFPGVTSSTPTTNVPTVKPPIGGERPIGSNNKETGIAPFVVGSNNVVENVDSAFVLGDDNFIGPNTSSGFISGDNNRINGNSDNVNLIGTKNTNVVAGTKNAVVIGGENETYAESDRIKFNAIIVGPTNFISAGRDVVLNQFPEGKSANYLSGSRDEVRNLGSHEIVNRVQA